MEVFTWTRKKFFPLCCMCVFGLKGKNSNWNIFSFTTLHMNVTFIHTGVGYYVTWTCGYCVNICWCILVVFVVFVVHVVVVVCLLLLLHFGVVFVVHFIHDHESIAVYTYWTYVDAVLLLIYVYLLDICRRCFTAYIRLLTGHM